MNNERLGNTSAKIATAILLSAMTPIQNRAGEPDPAAITLDKNPAWENAEPFLTPTVDIRARYEYGDTAGQDISHAETVRARLGVLTRAISGFRAFAEFEGTLAADRTSYQAASVHGTGRNKTVIADPESHELNRAWISYDGFANAELKAGRQRIILDNQRYIGNVGWRQNEQTFDAARMNLALGDDLDVTYAFFNQVARIFGSESPMLNIHDDFHGSSNLVHAKYTGLPIGTLSAHAYLLDLSNRAGDANSNQSYGVILSGPLPVDFLSYYLEYGFQTDAYNNPVEYSANYAHAILTASVNEVSKVSLGYEYLGSDNGVGFNTPLATLHAFNGYADVFLVTPPNGLQDIYLSGNTKLPWWDLVMKLTYHKFYSDGGTSNYGQELDFLVTNDLGKGFSFTGEYAYYWAVDGPYVDTNRFSVSLTYKY